jgi:hypothetical protein
MPSYPLQDQTTTQSSYSPDPWFQSQAANPYATTYGAWNTGSTPTYMSAQSSIQVKQEQQDDTLNNYSLNSFGGVNTSSSMRGSTAPYTTQPHSYVSESTMYHFLPNHLLTAHHRRRPSQIPLMGLSQARLQIAQSCSIHILHLLLLSMPEMTAFSRMLWLMHSLRMIRCF